jgi:hypothetical protein
MSKEFKIGQKVFTTEVGSGCSHCNCSYLNQVGILNN